MAYHYDPQLALEELREEALLPNPVYVRDMIMRAQLDPATALEFNRWFRDYQTHFAEAQKLGKELMQHLVERHT
ncbi:MAG: hypothetical protein ACYC6M_03215 [Terriglobales bacterium]